MPEKALNLVGLTSQEVGRSFALIAGVDTYPGLSGADRRLEPAERDLGRLVAYLRDYEFFDEIVLLRNDQVTDENFKYFLQAYFPSRLRAFPRSRFFFAYSGHGVQDGTRGYLLQAKAKSFSDRANSINMQVLATLYDEIVDSAHHSLALINACHSGAFSQRPFAERRQLLPQEPGHHVITAGGTSELAWHDARVGPGSVFFEKFFAGLDGLADRYPVQEKGPSGDGVVTVDELTAYLRQEVQLETAQRQNPLGSDISRDGSLGSFFFLDRRKQYRAGVVKDSYSDAMRPMGESPGPSQQPLLPQAATLADCGSGIDCMLKGIDAEDARDYEGAVRFYRKACQSGKGTIKACTKLGGLYEAGLGLDRDEVGAGEIYRKTCSLGDATGCSKLGLLYRQGVGVPQDYSQSGEFFRQGCDKGDAEACFDLGVLYAQGLGVKRDDQRAAQLFRQGCNKGGSNGCVALGAGYERGLGVGRDDKKAAELYRQACEDKNAKGCTNLGMLYRRSAGGTKNTKLAAGLYQQGCDGGDGRGCTELGVLYQRGEGFSRDPSRAADLYQKGCDKGDAGGCNNLGVLYRNGWGVAQDEELAAKLYRQVCDMGEPQGCTNLGFLYEEGLGVAQDRQLARQLYQLSCDKGDANGCKRLKR